MFYLLQRVDKPIDTLADFEKERYIFRTSIRQRAVACCQSIFAFGSISWAILA